jgi:DNA polymerase-1
VTGEKYLPHTWGKEKMLNLAALDAVTTLIVKREQEKQLSEKEKDLMVNHLIPLVYAIGRMEARGVLVDVQTLAAMYSQCAPILSEMDEMFSGLGINPRSPKQVKELLGLKDANKETLKYNIKRGHPKSELMEKLLEYRHLDKMASVYLKGVYDRMESGRIHTHYKIDGTGTGRLSSEDPNLQNVPEEMRVVYASDPEHIFIKGDYSQIELWVGAIIAHEETMLKDLLAGVDIHYISCQLCFPHVPLKAGNRKGDFSHREGLIAKTVTFGTFYGRTAHSISREFGVTVREAEEWQIKILNKYPALLKYRERCEFETRTKGYLVTPFGRKRYITTDRQGYNFPIQSTASDITLGSIRLADAAGLEPVISVHDDIVFQVKETNWKKEVLKIKKVMERKIPELSNLPFKVEYAKGTNWYDLTAITK